MMKVILVLPLVSAITAASANCAATPVEPIEVALKCVPSSKSLVYRCDVQILHKALGAPICFHGGSINFDMPSMPMAHHIPQLKLDTDAEGRMKNWEVKLDMYGEWRVRFNVSGQNVSKTFNFQPRSVREK